MDERPLLYVAYATIVIVFYWLIQSTMISSLQSAALDQIGSTETEVSTDFCSKIYEEEPEAWSGTVWCESNGMGSRGFVDVEIKAEE